MRSGSSLFFLNHAFINENMIIHLQKTWKIQNKVTYSSASSFFCVYPVVPAPFVEKKSYFPHWIVLAPLLKSLDQRCRKNFQFYSINLHVCPCSDFVRYFFCEMVMWFLFFIWLTHVTLIDSQMSHQPCIVWKVLLVHGVEESFSHVAGFCLLVFCWGFLHPYL